MNDFENIKSLYPIEDFISTQTGKAIKKVGSSLNLEVCPFCGHKDCFRIFPKTRSYKCFSCGSGGDIFSFAKEFFKIADNYQALKKVAEIVNYKIQNSKNIQQTSKPLAIRQKIFNMAAEFYHKQLSENKKALQILSETRNFSIKTVEKFKLGYSGDKKNALLDHLRGQFSEEELIHSGLFKIRNDKLEDFFIPKLFIYPHFKGKNCVDFSIKDAQKQDKKPNQVIDYRLPNDFRLTKHKFWNEDALYFDEVIITEGQNDAIQIMRHTGVLNAMAITGNPSEKSLEYLKKRLEGKTIYLCFDADDAGQIYFEKFFFLLWGLVEQIFKIVWDGSSKDIDEFLRLVTKHHAMDGRKVMADLLNNAPDALQAMIESIPDEEDLQKLMRHLTPFMQTALKNDDPIGFEVALELVREHFKKGKSAARFLHKQFERARLEQFNNADYLENLPFYEKNGVYFHRMSKGDVNISNFRLHIKDRVQYGDEIFYRCDIKSVSGEIAENVEFSPAERVDARKFRTKLAAVGAFHFTGRDNELSGIWQYEEAKGNTRHIYYLRKYGWIPQENIWIFDNCAIRDGILYTRDPETDFIRIGSKHYKTQDVLVYSGARPKLNLEFEYSPDFAQKVSKAFHYMLDSTPRGTRDTYMGYLFLGFLPATLYSNEIFEHYGFFPMLFSYGPPGTGKTHATRLLLNCFGFVAQPESWSSASVAGTYQFVQQISSMPCWYDEFLNDRTFQELLGTIKNIYNRVGAGKGGKNEIRTLREVNGTLWLSGEDNPANEAVLSRSILFRFSSLNNHKNKAYAWLLENSDKLSVLAKQLLLEKTEEKARIFIRQIERYKEFIMQRMDRVDPRVATNHAIVTAGLQIMDIDVPYELDEYLVRHVAKTMQFKEAENPRYLFFAEVNHLYSKGFLRDSVKFDEYDNELCVRFEPVIRAIQYEIRKRGDNLRIKASSIKDYLMDMPGFVGIDRRYFPAGESTSQKRCMIFKYPALPEKMKEALIDIVDQ